jgi:RHS repeat-associated protein
MNQYPTVTPAGGSAETQNYDNNGNLTGDGTSTYSYDPENHLMTASNTGMTAAYAYDPLGRRETKTVGSTVTEFLNDGQDEIAEYDASGDVLRRFVPGPAINEPIVYENCSGATQPNCTGTGPSIEYYHTDHLGSVIATSGASQAIQEGPYIYDPNGVGGLTTGQPFQYVGMYYDFETGLYYDRARYYSTQLGRFLQTDPVGYKDDIDWYTYVGNDPTDRTDPKGLWSCGQSANSTSGGQQSCSATRGALGVLRGLTPEQKAKLSPTTQARLQGVLNFYGADDKANGVTVNESRGSGGSADTVGGRTTITLGVGRDGGNPFAVAAQAAHEGWHGIDETQRWHGRNPANAYEEWDTEMRAYTLQSEVNHATGYHGQSSLWNDDPYVRQNNIFGGAQDSMGGTYPNALWDPTFREYMTSHESASW